MKQINWFGINLVYIFYISLPPPLSLSLFFSLMTSLSCTWCMSEPAYTYTICMQRHIVTWTLEWGNYIALLILRDVVECPSRSCLLRNTKIGSWVGDQFKFQTVYKVNMRFAGLSWLLLLIFFLFVWCFTSHWRIFHSYGDVTIIGEGLQILTYTRHSWSFSSWCSLKCHTYCDTEHTLIKVIFEDPWHSHLLQAYGSGAVTTCFPDLGLSWLGFEHPTFRMQGERSNRLCPRDGFCCW